LEKMKAATHYGATTKNFNLENLSTISATACQKRLMIFMSRLVRWYKMGLLSYLKCLTKRAD